MTVLTQEQALILDHTLHRAAGNLCCTAGGPDMDRLVDLGLMKFAGRKSFVPEPYYTITATGRQVARTPAFRNWIQTGQRGNVDVAIPDRNPLPVNRQDAKP